MKKIQEGLNNFIKQYDFLKTSYKYDVILMAIYPVYLLLYRIGVSFIYDISKFSTLFILMFFAGLILCVANNKIKETALANAVLCILFLIGIFNGSVDNIVYGAFYGFIAFSCYKLMNNNEVINSYSEHGSNGQKTTEMNMQANSYKAENKTEVNIENVRQETEQENKYSNSENTVNNTMQLNIRSVDLIGLWQPLAAAVVVIFAMVQDWLKIDMEFVSGTYSISNIKDVMDRILSLANDFGADTSDFMGAATFVNVLHYGMYVIVIAEVVFILTKIIDNEKYKTFAMVGSMLTIIIAVVIFILKVYIGVKIADEFGSSAEGVFSMTWYPLIAVAGALWQLGVMGQRGRLSAPGLEVVGKKCKVCGTMNHEEAERCGKCGSTLSGFDVVYKK